MLDDRVTRIRGDRDDVFSHGFICPKGSTLKQLHDDPDRVRTPLIKRDGVFVAGDVGRGLRRGRPPADPDHRASRPRRRRRLPRQPERSLTLGGALPQAADQGARHEQRVLRQHGRPAPEGDLVGVDVRWAVDRAGSRHRPHRLPARARRQPVRIERQPGDRPRLARAHRGVAGTWRAARRRRPPAQPYGRGGRRMDRDPPGHRPVPARRDGRARSSTRTWSTSAPSATSSAGSTACSAPWRRIDAGVRGEHHGHRCRHDPPARPRPRHRPDRPRSTGGSARPPPSSAPWRAGSSTCSTSLTGNLDRPGGAMFTTPAAAGRTPMAHRGPADRSGSAPGLTGARTRA